MTPSLIAMSIIFGIILIGAIAGIYAGFHREMDLEQWTVGGRGFGLIFVWLLLAGEIYTTFSFLGASGWVYSRGAPTLYIIAYIVLGNVISFLILPRVWQLGRKFQLHTIADFFQARYRSKSLSAIVALIGVLFIVPYLQLQLTGLGIIVQIASFDAVNRATAILIAFVIVAGFVLSSGIRAVAWVSVLKDSMMLTAAVCVGIGVPYHYFHGIKPMFQALIQAHPQHMTMPGSTTNMGHTWYLSSVLLSALGAYMWPHTFGSAFSAKNGETLRRNAIIMPLYTISLPLLLLAGYAAILVTPGLKNGDLALLMTIRKTFSPWFLGFVGGAGALTAMVPAAILILTAGTLFAKNFFRPCFAPSMADDAVAKLAKVIVVVMTATAMYFAIYSSSTLVSLLLFGYTGVAQFLPGVIFGLFWKRANALGVFAGLVAGVGAGVALEAMGKNPFYGWNAGFLALCSNFAITFLVSTATSSRSTELFEEEAHQRQVVGEII